MKRLFVYGTLGLGQSNDYLLTSIGGTWHKAVVRGRKLPDGWDGDGGYPGVVVDPQGEPISGFLFSAPDLGKHWAKLDAYEGGNYRRVPVRVELETGEELEAQIYEAIEKGDQS